MNDPGTTGCFLSDGVMNLAILHFKNDQAASVERGASFKGIHHIGFAVEDMATIQEKVAAAGSVRRHDVEQALDVMRRLGDGLDQMIEGGLDGPFDHPQPSRAYAHGIQGMWDEHAAESQSYPTQGSPSSETTLRIPSVLLLGTRVALQGANQPARTGGRNSCASNKTGDGKHGSWIA